jgi:hypothetical protein
VDIHAEVRRALRRPVHGRRGHGAWTSSGALEREANPKANVGGYSFYYSVIKGFDDFAAGKADTISGLSAPDASTLTIELTAPDGRPQLPPGDAGGGADPAER